MKRRLTLVIHSLEGGGAERMLAAMANHWAGSGNEVTLITLSSSTTDAYPLDSRVHRIGLDVMRPSQSKWQAVRNNIRRLRRLRAALRDARGDCVISFTDQMNILTLLAARGLRQPVVICERVDPRQHTIGRWWSYLRRRTYRRCTRLVVQTDSVREFFRGIVLDEQIRVIGNPAWPAIAASNSCHLGKSSDLPRTLLAVGRLAPQKGFDLLIDAFAQVASRFPDWRLAILGSGAEREALIEQAACLGVSQSVELLGWTADIATWLGKADLFVLSSRYEGFPNVLLEAMAAGLPVISFDCESGPREIVRHEVDGLLVPAGDVAALTHAMGQMMADEPLRETYGQRAREVTERFGVAEFFHRWEQVLAECIPAPSKKGS